MNVMKTQPQETKSRRARALKFNEAVKRDIERVKKFAEEHRYNIQAIKDRIRDKTGKSVSPPPGDLPGHSLVIPEGFRVVYSIDESHMGWVHHFSISTPDPGRAVNEFGLRFIADEFGLNGRKFNAVWTEEIGPNHIAINAIMPYEDTKSAGGERRSVEEQKDGQETRVESGAAQPTKPDSPNPG